MSLTHAVNGQPIDGPVPPGQEVAIVGLGCFWGAERVFWQLSGVVVTSVGYAGGHAATPSYREVCGGRTGHAEVVRIVFDPAVLPYERLLATFWESHDPTQGDRQWNDIGPQYRSIVFCADEHQRTVAEQSRDAYAARLAAAGYPPITTEIVVGGDYHLAEDYHQQYLEKNPDGYCGLRGTGIACAVPGTSLA
jgi:peptide-methionine (S)-S-oxide reductase